MRTVQRWLAITIVAMLAISLQPFGTLASPGDSRSEREDPSFSEPADVPAPTELIVRLRPGTESSPDSRLNGEADVPSAARLANRVGRGLQSRTPFGDGSDMHLFSFDDAGSAADALATLQDDPDVEFVEPNHTRELHWVPDTEEYFADQQGWVETMRLPDAWNITTGDPELVVAVIDSGVSPTHPDLADKLVPGYNAVDGSDNSADIEGHGTRVAGIIAAANNEVGTVGAAMDVRIMPIRVLGDDKTISVTSIYDAIIWAVDNGADVLNLSFGSDTASETERSAVQYAYERNIPIVASAGNRFNRISYPASYPESIAVGSLDAQGNRSHFSSIITTVDVAAPGELIFSPSWDENRGDHWDERLFNGRAVEGTSFSSAIVSGVVALQKSVNPGLTVEQVRSILTSTAIDTGEPGPEAGVGAGQVDAEAATRTVAFWSMYDTWYPADFPVATGSVVRTWLWGTDPPATFAYEAYAEAQHNVRLVYYYDKSRMELTNPLIDRGERWYITNGLLVNEMISGDVQIGDGEFDTRQPAAVNVAGDLDDVLGPTYASFSDLLEVPPLEQGQVIVETITRTGDVGSDERFAQYDVWAEYLESTTNHRVADVFWNYLNSYGLVAYGETLVEDALFDPWFYATGLPVTEAYWSQVTVGGQVLDVLVQCFERRCMTYTPSNDAAWRVEMGNVGLHYHAWRYSDEPAPPVEPEPVDPPEADVLYESTLADWPEATVEGASMFPGENGYHMQVTDSDGASVEQFAPLVDADAIDESLDIRAVGDSKDADACLLARYDQVSMAGYVWCIGSNGETFASYQGTDSEGNDVSEVLLPRALRASVNPVDEWHTFGLMAQGDELVFTLNGSEAGTVQHAGSAAGSVGISVVNRGDGVAEYAFRDLLVTSVINE